MPGGYVVDGISRIGHMRGGKAELFYLAKDPGEKNDVAAQDPQLLAALEERLKAVFPKKWETEP